MYSGNLFFVFVFDATANTILHREILIALPALVASPWLPASLPQH